MRKTFERYLTVEDERQLFKTVKKYKSVYARRDFAWMRLLRQTGIRVGTLVGLTVMDCREALKTDYLTIRPEIVKGGNGGRIYVTKAGRKALRELLQLRREMGKAEQPGAPLVISRKGGQAMTVRGIELAMSKWVKLSGLSVAASPHWFRHTVAKRIMKDSTAADPRGVVQAALLHKSVSSTAVYTQPDREDIEQALEEVS